MKKRSIYKLIFFGSLITLGLFIAPSHSQEVVSAEEVNLAPNPSFEAGTTGPDGWHYRTISATHTWRSGVAHTGNRSVCIGNSQPYSGGEWESDLIPIQAERAYKLGVWAKGDFVRDAKVFMIWYDANGSMRGGVGIHVSFNNANWTYSELAPHSVQVDAVAARLKVVISNPVAGYGHGEVCFDDIIFQEGDKKLYVPLSKQGIWPFSDNNPPWEGIEYDHSNSQDLWCGTTMAQCGCATTSIAMILDYYGVFFDPDGNPTTPATVNNYFRRNPKCNSSGCISLGYSYGNVRWPAVNQYSREAHNRYGFPNVIWNGRINNHNPQTIRDDIGNNRPVILEEPGHFIVATGISGDTFLINDPLFNRTRLDDPAYNNSSLGLRRYRYTWSDFSTLEVVALAPAQVLVIDPNGNQTGFDPDSSAIVTEIPDSDYFFEGAIADDSGENPTPPAGEGVNVIIINTPQEGKYEIEVTAPPNEVYSFAVYGSDQDANVDYDLFEREPAPGEQDLYIVTYDPNPGSTPFALNVPVDIKPGSYPNSINCDNDKGVIAVAILTTETFDATTVDHTTVTFEGTSEMHVNHKTGELQRHEKDVDRDGDIDLVFHFKLGDTDLACEHTEGMLIGETFDGLKISGSDSVRMIIAP